MHSGAEEAIFLFMQAVLSPGDHLIVHWPCYQSLHEVARSIGREVTFWQAREDGDWALNLDDLAGHIRPATRAAIVNTPHNPTGWLMPRDDFDRLNRMLDQRGIVLFSDEVYRESEYSADDRLPAACDLSRRSVSLDIMASSLKRLDDFFGRHASTFAWVRPKAGPIALVRLTGSEVDRFGP